MNDNYLFGAAQIAIYIGETRNSINRLQKDLSLPAYRMTERGRWKAKKTDLDSWLDDQKNSHISDYPKIEST
jgi:hypothetical protein